MIQDPPTSRCIAIQTSKKGNNNAHELKLRIPQVALSHPHRLCPMVFILLIRRCQVPVCRGVEFSGQRCEIWSRPEGIEASIPLAGAEQKRALKGF